MLEERCRRLRELHVRGRPLVLPNAWDAASARAVVAAGYPAVATTSGGVAESLGYEDHEQAPREEMLAAARRVASSVEVPVTVDFEAGYGLEPEALVEALREAGAAGCNLEDSDHAAGGLVETGSHAERLAAVRRAARERGYGLVLNARVDVFLAGRGRPQPELLDEAVTRARAYLEAGADCVYPIFLSDRDTIGAFVQAVAGPTNILCLPDAPAVPELARLGVARVSYGSLLHRRTMAAFAEMLVELR